MEHTDSTLVETTDESAIYPNDGTAIHSAMFEESCNNVVGYRLYKGRHRVDVYRSPNDDDSRGAVYLPLLQIMALLLAAFVVGYITGGKDPIPGRSGTRPSVVVPGNAVHRLVTLRAHDGAIKLSLNRDGNAVLSEVIVSIQVHDLDSIGRRSVA